MEKNKYFLEIKSQQLKLVRLVFIFSIVLGSFLFIANPVHAVDVSDTFDRPNEDPIGGNWTKGTASNNLKISSNAVVPSTAWQPGWYYWNADAFENDQYSEGLLTTAGGGVIVRMNPSSNTYYLFTYVSGYEWQLRKVVDGVSTNLTGLITVGPVTNFARLEVNGNLLVAKVRGRVIASVFDSDISTGSPGIYGIYGGLSTWAGGDLNPSCAPDGCYTVVTCSHGETGTCREPIDLTSEKVQTTINASSNGDGLYLKSGSADWSSPVTLIKEITFVGAGKENTLITMVSGGYCGADPSLTCMMINSNNVDISNIGFRIGHSGAQSIYVGGGYTGLKIHDSDFRRTVNRPSGNTHHIMLVGNARGVIYKNYFYGGGVGFDGPDSGGLSSSDPNWTSATGFGGTDFMFVEGNTFSNANSFGLATGGARVMYANTGAKTVFRYNSLLNEDSRVEVGDVDGHSFCSGTRAVRAYEIYNNLMQSVSPAQRLVYLRGGTGLVYKNKIYPGYMQLNEYRVSIGQGGYGELVCPYCRPVIETKSSSHCFSTYYGITTSLASSNYPLGSTVHGVTSGTDAVVIAQGTGSNITFSSYANGDGFLNGESLTIGGVSKGTATSIMATFHGEGYPCYDQIGRGDDQNTEPYFFWNNVDGSDNPITPSVPDDMTSYIQADRDYCNHDTSTSCNSITVNYSPYQCPHPLADPMGEASCDSNEYGTAGYYLLTSDTTPPTVTAFTIPSTSNSLTVPISTFTATDDTAVTGYMVTESSSAPASGDPGWQGSAPTQYIFATEGAKTLYAWAKDAAGNVSTSFNDSLTITLPTYSVGGTISGLTGTVILQNNLGDDLSRSANGVFTFATELHDGDPYSVTVLTQPAGQTCVVTNGSGSVSGGDISNVSVACSDNPDLTAPTVDTFTIPATSASLTVPITDFTASDAVGVTGYMLTEVDVAPVSGDPGWSGTAPTEYVFSTEGAKTLYAWAKDSAGNVSTSLNDSVTITLPTYSVGGTISGLTGTVILQNSLGDDLSRSANGAFTFATALHDSDAYSVTVSTQPDGQTCSVSNGSGTVSGENISNISVSCEDGADETAPSVTAFTIPATSSSLTVSISSFTASDAVGVTGYMLTESALAPAAGAPGWSGTAPASYTFSSEGSKTLYSWAKDAAGNVSTSLNDLITITLPVPDSALEDDQEDYDDLDISSLKYSVIGLNQIKITFKTNNEAKGTAKFGTDRNLKQKKKESKNRKVHTIKLINLIPGAKYFFRLSAEDEHDQSDRTKIYSVTLPKAAASTPAVKKSVPQSASSAYSSSSQNQENKNTPVSQNSLPPEQKIENTPNQTKENLNNTSNNSNSANSFNSQSQPQKKIFRWWNPFTWF